MNGLPNSPTIPAANWRRFLPRTKLSWFLVSIAAIVLLYWLFFRSTRTVSVIGKAQMTVQPDQASVTFSLTHEDPDRTQTISEGERQFNQLVGKAQEYNVSKLDRAPFQITTTGVGQSRRFRYTNAARITLSDPTQMNQLIADLYFLGATSVGQPRYTTSDESVEADLRALALQDARERVRQIARNTGVRVGRIVNIQETNSNVLSGSSVNTTGTTTNADEAAGQESESGDENGANDADNNDSNNNFGSSTGIELSTTVVVTYELW